MNSFMADDQASVSVSRLLAFRAENVRSFRDGLELPMLATGLADEGVPRSVTWHEGGRPVQVLPAAGILRYGARSHGDRMHNRPYRLGARVGCSQRC